METNTLVHLSFGPILLLMGYIFKRYPPQKITRMRGYRTPRSMRSQETWDAAHQYIANWILTMGMIVMGIQIPLFFLLEPSQFAIGLIGKARTPSTLD